jgi:hypothetical protein
MSAAESRMSDNAVRIIGAVLGVALGALIVIYLDRHRTPAPPVPPASSTHSTASVTPVNTTDLNEAAARQALETARLDLAADADAARALLGQDKPLLDSPRAEVAQLEMLPEEEIRTDIEQAYTEVGDYAAQSSYGPEKHATLYRRVNTLWDIRGLPEKENGWLGEAVATLNELAVRHAEKSYENGRYEAVVRVAKSLGDWTYRLNKDQEQRLASVLQETSARLRSGT